MSNITAEGGSKVRRITPEQASAFVSVEDDTTNTPSYYFTFTPDSENPGWDKVTYYTNILKSQYNSKLCNKCPYTYGKVMGDNGVITQNTVGHGR